MDDLSLHILPGEIYGFIGHNGAGFASMVRLYRKVVNGLRFTPMERMPLKKRKMQNISERIQQTLLQEYGLEACDIHKMTTGVGGDFVTPFDGKQARFATKVLQNNI